MENEDIDFKNWTIFGLGIIIALFGLFLGISSLTHLDERISRLWMAFGLGVYFLGIALIVNGSFSQRKAFNILRQEIRKLSHNGHSNISENKKIVEEKPQNSQKWIPSLDKVALYGIMVALAALFYPVVHDTIVNPGGWYVSAGSYIICFIMAFFVVIAIERFEYRKKADKNNNPSSMTNQEFVEEEDQNEELSLTNSRHILWARAFSLVGVAAIIISVLGIWFWKPLTNNSNILAAELALYGVGIAVALFGADLSLKLESDKKLFDNINVQNSIIMQMQQDDIKRDEKLKKIEEMVKKWDFIK